MAHAWTDARSPEGDARRSTIDLVGPGLTLFLGPDAEAPARDPARSGSAPLTTVPLKATAARALGIGPTGAVLVRPDGLPVASWWTVNGRAVTRRRGHRLLHGASAPGLRAHRERSMNPPAAPTGSVSPPSRVTGDATRTRIRILSVVLTVTAVLTIPGGLLWPETSTGNETYAYRDIEPIRQQWWGLLLGLAVVGVAHRDSPGHRDPDLVRRRGLDVGHVGRWADVGRRCPPGRGRGLPGRRLLLPDQP